MKFNLNLLGIILDNYTNVFLKDILTKNTILIKNCIHIRLNRQKSYNKITKIGNNKHIYSISEIASHRIAIGTDNGMIYIFDTNKPYNLLTTIKAFEKNEYVTNICGLYNNSFAASGEKIVKVWEPITNDTYELIQTIIEEDNESQIYLASIEEYLVAIFYIDRMSYVNYYNIAKDFEMRTVYEIDKRYTEGIYVMKDNSLLIIANRNCIVMIGGQKPYKFKFEDEICDVVPTYYRILNKVPDYFLYDYTYENDQLEFPFYKELNQVLNDCYANNSRDGEFDKISKIIRLRDERYIMMKYGDSYLQRKVYLYGENLKFIKKFRFKDVLKFYLTKTEKLVVITKEADIYIII
jgi:hypothetical protein